MSTFQTKDIPHRIRYLSKMISQEIFHYFSWSLTEKDFILNITKMSYLLCLNHGIVCDLRSQVGQSLNENLFISIDILQEYNVLLDLKLGWKPYPWPKGRL